MAKKKSLDMLPIEDLILDHDLQIRVHGVDEAHALEMVDEAKAGSLPRVKIAHVKDLGLIVTDGWHTIRAHVLAGMKLVGCEVTDCSRFEMQIACAKANREHLGKHRTREDKRKAIAIVLAACRTAGDDWSDKRISEEVCVSRDLVRIVRNEQEDEDEGEAPATIPMPEMPRPSKGPAKAPAVKSALSSTDGVSWETVPLTEFINADNFTMGGLARSQVKTAGELYKRILAGESFGLQKSDVLDLKDQVEKLRDAEEAIPSPKASKPKAVGAPKGFDHAAFDRAYAFIATSIDEYANLFPDYTTNERNTCLNIQNQFRKIWNVWVQRAEPKG